jgi:Arc/MetJ-type ribon-helix-helix transcriptional regulator
MEGIVKTEKVSVNLTPTELGQIDLLVERGLFDGRSDFMRSAARKSLDSYASDFKQFLEPEYLKEEKENELRWAVGISGLTKGEVNHLIGKGKKIHIRTIGLFNIAKGITPEEIRQIVLSCKVYGKLTASDEVKEALRDIEERGN